MGIDFSKLSVEDCPLCKQLTDNPDAVHCSVCHRALCVEHITCIWNPIAKRAEQYFCREHRPPTPPPKSTLEEL